MRVRTRRLLAVALALIVAGAAALWWFDARTRRDAVVGRLGDALVARFPGAGLAAVDANYGRVTLASGRAIDVRAERVVERCKRDRFACSDAIARAVEDAVRVDQLAQKPQGAALHVAVVDEVNRGYQLGFIADPLVGPLEVRYALVDGDASTFVTPAIADLMQLPRSAIRPAAVAWLTASGSPRVEALADAPGAYRVLGEDDPSAELAVPERMRALCSIVGTSRLIGVVAGRGLLLIARDDAAGRDALRSKVASRTTTVRAPVVFTYDSAHATAPLAPATLQGP